MTPLLQNKIIKLCMNFANLPITLHEALTEIFESADISNDGKISLPEYLRICDNYGILLTDDDLASFESLEDSEGLVSKSDFIAYIKNSNLLGQFDNVDTSSDVHWNTMVEKAWQLFDKNGDGKLTQMEFRWMTRREVLTDSQIKLMFSKCDTDGDGVLDFDEFRRMILRNRYVRVNSPNPKQSVRSLKLLAAITQYTVVITQSK